MIWTSPILQQPLDFDFASGGKADASVDDEREDEPRREGGPIALAVLFRGAGRLAGGPFFHALANLG